MVSHQKKWLSSAAIILLSCTTTATTSFAAPTTPADSVLARTYTPEKRAKLLSLKSTIYEGTLEVASLKGTFAAKYVAPDKAYTLIDLRVLKSTQIFNGDKGWQVDQNGAISEISGAELAMNNSAQYVQSGAYLLPDSTAVKEYLGAESFGDHGCHHFRFVPQSGAETEVYIDSLSGDVIGMRQKLGDITLETRQSDFRLVDGYSFPFSVDVVASVPQLSMTQLVTRCVVNTPIDTAIFSPGDAPAAHDYTFAGNKDSVVVPLSYRHNHVYIQATINDKTKVHLLLDTGAGTNILDHITTDSAGAVPEGEIAALGVAGMGKASFVKINKIDIGGLSLDSQTVGSMDLRSMFAAQEISIDGILGYDFFSRFVIAFNFAESTMTVYRPGSEPRFTETPLPITYTSKIPVVTAQVGDTTGSFVLDMGNNSDLIVHPAFATATGLDKLAIDSSQSAKMGGVGGSITMNRIAIPTFVVGTVTVTNQPAHTTSQSIAITAREEIAGNIGMGFLRNYRLVLDYPHDRISLSSIETK